MISSRERTGRIFLGAAIGFTLASGIIGDLGFYETALWLGILAFLAFGGLANVASERRAMAGADAPYYSGAEGAAKPIKPRVRVSSDGWVRNAGGGFPFHPGTLVELAFDDGRMRLKPHGVETAGYWHESWWKREAKRQGRNIAFYRIVRLSPPVTKAPRIAR